MTKSSIKHKKRRIFKVTRSNRRKYSTKTTSHSMDVDSSPITTSHSMDVDSSPITTSHIMDIDYSSPSSCTKLNIGFLIMGHGGLINYVTPNTGILETFKNPDNVNRTEIVAIRFSSLPNLTSNQQQQNADEYLTNTKRADDILIKGLNDHYLYYLKKYYPLNKTDVYKKEEVIKMRKAADILGKKYDNHFFRKATVTTKMAQKIYSGITREDIPYFHSDFNKHNILGPFVKIYSIKAENTELLNIGESIPIYNIPNNITLTDIIHQVTAYVFSDNLLHKGINPNYKIGKKININVVDLACNTTIGAPMIGFIE